MVSVLIVSEDNDVASLLSLILDQAGYTADRMETVAELFRNSAAFELIILDRPFNLLPEDWNALKKLKEKQGKLPIAITNSPQTSWLQENSRVVGIDLIFPYPCDLTVELPDFLKTYFGS